jgi:UDP-N-acetylmuramoyl-tripeptide--D-alanyl-D-alanine ligase
MSEVEIIREFSGWDSTGCDLRWGSEQGTLTVAGISLEARDSALRALQDRIRHGETLAEALWSVSQELQSSRLPVGVDLAEDVILVDASAVTQASPAVDVVKSVSALARGVRRIVAVAGALDFSGESDYDNLSAFGALMVRLNVDQVFAVGRGARALFLSVGMEGSWDGESRFCEDSDSAYDDIRAHIRPGDVVLILGSTDESFTEMVGKLKADLS